MSSGSENTITQELWEKFSVLDQISYLSISGYSKTKKKSPRQKVSVVSHNCGIFNCVSPSWFPNRDQKSLKTASSTVLEASDFLAQPSILTPFPRLPLNYSLDSWERGTLVWLTTPLSLSYPTNLFCFLSPWTPLTPTCPSKPPL